MEQNLSMRQRQTLQLSPQMYQSLRLLQMNIIELNKWLEKESQENPLLEVDFKEYSIGSESASQKKDLDNEIGNKYDNSSLDYFFDWKVALNKNKLSFKQEGEIKSANKLFKKITLSEHLLSNFRIIARDEIEFKIGEYLIGNINNNGYLVVSCKEVATDLNIPEKKVRQVLAMIQNCSIPGVGARNLKECLLIQLKELKLPEKELLKKLILFYLEKLSKKEFKEICRDLHLSYSEIQHLEDVLKKYFDPKPGRAFAQDNEVDFLVPDIIIKKINGQYEILENKSFFPTMKINSFYEKMLLEYQKAEKIGNQEKFSSEKWAENKKTLEYLKEKIAGARWVLKCLEQRRTTILNITKFIINYQQDFLEKGVNYLRPLSLEEAAQALGLNKSTISRAIKSKKVQLPRGIFELKYFFSRGLSQNYHKVISNEKIKEIIKKYIEEEDLYQPYSDQKLCEILQEKEDIKIARRTVAKYRSLMDIPSAKLRRRYK